MLFDPSILLRDPLAVLAVLGIILLGKTLVALATVRAFGYPVSTALTVAASLAQIGEFSLGGDVSRLWGRLPRGYSRRGGRVRRARDPDSDSGRPADTPCSANRA